MTPDRLGMGLAPGKYGEMDHPWIRLYKETVGTSLHSSLGEEGSLRAPTSLCPSLGECLLLDPAPLTLDGVGVGWPCAELAV